MLFKNQGFYSVAICKKVNSFQGSHFVLLLTLMLFFVSAETSAFKLKPTGTTEEKIVSKLERTDPRWLRNIVNWGINHFTNPVHEDLTNRIWGCEEDLSGELKCASWPRQVAPIIYGVHWNDNPPFGLTKTNNKLCKDVKGTIRLPEQYIKCWFVLFHDAKKNARKKHYNRKNGHALIYRVHFGDMQFLHSMASWKGESMRETKRRIMMWAEFTYKMAIGEIPFTIPVSDVPVAGFATLFKGNGYTARNLFVRSVPRFWKEVPLVAFGSLLHMIEDSFSKSHVDRAYPSGDCEVASGVSKPGRIREFYSYSGQDSSDHGGWDSKEAMQAGLIRPENALTVGRKLKEMFDTNKPWSKVRGYLDQCVYEVDQGDLDEPAGQG